MKPTNPRYPKLKEDEARNQQLKLPTIANIGLDGSALAATNALGGGIKGNSRRPQLQPISRRESQTKFEPPSDSPPVNDGSFPNRSVSRANPAKLKPLAGIPTSVSESSTKTSLSRPGYANVFTDKTAVQPITPQDRESSARVRQRAKPVGSGGRGRTNPGRAGSRGNAITNNTGNTSRQTGRTTTTATAKTSKLTTNKTEGMGKYEKLITGCLDDLPQPRSSTIRVFLSSTFSDFSAERNDMSRNVIPKVKSFCSELGLDLQVMDLRWGIPEEATDEHIVEQICLAEVENCKRLSPGLNFVALLGNRYGFRPVPAECEASEFEGLKRLADNLQLPGRDLLNMWYKKDTNAVPPAYVLQPIHFLLPNFNHATDKLLYEEARKKWREINATIQSCLQQSARAASNDIINEERKHFYSLAVTEKEICQGLCSEDSARSCLFYKRNLEGVQQAIDDEQSQNNIAKYTDVIQASNQWQICTDSQQALHRLWTETVTKFVPKENCKENKLSWKPEGVDPEVYDDHKDYMTSFFDQLSTDMIGMIAKFDKAEKLEQERECTYTIQVKPKQLTSQDLQKYQKQQNPNKRQNKGQNKSQMLGISQADFFLGKMAVQNVITLHQNVQNSGTEIENISDRSRIALHKEILHHLLFCESRCQVFCGRDEELDTVRTYFKEKTRISPLVIYAPSGGGKTAFTAMIIKMSKKWLGQNCVSIVRFLGISPASSNIRRVLKELCQQICIAYGEVVDEKQLHKMRMLNKYLSNLLMLVSIKYGSHRPLVIILDSVDQLEPSNGAHELTWLPTQLPSNVYLVMSTLPDVHGCLDHAKALIQDKKYFLGLTKLSEKTTENYVELYLSRQKRTLTKDQLSLLVRHIKGNSQPLYMKLLADEASTWNSYTPLSDLNLASTINEAIGNLFGKVEKKYGDIFIQAALGAVTVGLGGLTEIELEDVLSCNDAVLNEVYQFHDPPLDDVIRIPPLIWARLRYELGDYMAERQVYSKTTLQWYHRQFKEAAVERYASGSRGIQLHADLGAMFAAKSAVCRTITLQQRNKTLYNADRQITLQAVAPTNKRKLEALAYHLYQAGQLENLARECYCNYNYLICYITAFSLNEVLSELHAVLHSAAASAGTSSAKDALQIVYTFLRYASQTLRNTETLSTQILVYLLQYADENGTIRSLCEQARAHLNERKKSSLVPICGSASTRSELEWYLDGVAEISSVNSDNNAILIRRAKPDDSQPTCRILNTERLELGRNLQEALGIQRCVISSKKQRVYVLTKKQFKVFSATSGLALQVGSADINKAGVLNALLAVSTDDNKLVLAGTNRLAMLEDNSSNPDEVDFQSKRAMSLGGSVESTNLIISNNGESSISSHAIKGEKKTIGVVVLWEFSSQALKGRVPLPCPVEEGFLYATNSLGESDIFICGCRNGQTFLVNMTLGTMIRELSQSGTSAKQNILSAYCIQQDLLVSAVAGEKTLKVWSSCSSDTNLRDIWIMDCSIISLALTTDGAFVVLGDDSGIVKLAKTESGEITKCFKVGDQPITRVICNERDELFTLSARCLKLWNINRLVDIDNSGNKRIVAKPTNEPQQFEKDMFCFDTSLDSRHLVIGDGGGIDLWSLQDDRCNYISSYKISHPVVQVSFLCKGVTIAALTGENNMHILIMGTDNNISEISSADCPAVVPNIDTYVVDRDTGAITLLQRTNTNLHVLRVSSNPFKFTELASVSENLPLGHIVPDKSVFIGQNLIFLARESPSDHTYKEHSVRLFNLQTNSLQTCQLPSATQPRNTPSTEANNTVFSLAKVNEDEAVIGCLDEARVWNPVNDLLQEADKSRAREHSFRFSVKGKKGIDLPRIPITAVAAASQGKILVTGAEDGTIILWPEKGQARILKSHCTMVSTIAVSPDCSLVVTGSHDRRLYLHDVTHGHLLHEVAVHMPVVATQFTPDGRILIAKAQDMDNSRIMCYQIHNPN